MGNAFKSKKKTGKSKMDLVDSKKKLLFANQKPKREEMWEKGSLGLRNRGKERIKSTKVVKVFTGGKFIVIHCDLDP